MNAVKMFEDLGYKVYVDAHGRLLAKSCDKEIYIGLNEFIVKQGLDYVMITPKELEALYKLKN